MYMQGIDAPAYGRPGNTQSASVCGSRQHGRGDILSSHVLLDSYLKQALQFLETLQLIEFGLAYGY